MPVSYKSDINTIKEIFMDVTKIVITGGVTNGKSGNTDRIKVEII